MYIPESFRETRREVLQAFIRDYSFATLVSCGQGRPVASHLPFLLNFDRGSNGVLQGHMARANPQWREFADRPEVMVIFQGPHAYISPSYYSSDFAVPTWNYAAVHVRGSALLIEDEARLRMMLGRLVETSEASSGSQWTISWDDKRYEQLLGAIVGFEIEIAEIEGKFKLNQNRPVEDRQAVVEVLGGAHRHDVVGAVGHFETETDLLQGGAEEVSAGPIASVQLIVIGGWLR